jgi:hypothetical protein
MSARCAYLGRPGGMIMLASAVPRHGIAVVVDEGYRTLQKG